MAKWSAGEEIAVPSIVNRKLGHYAAIVSKDASGKYRVKDRTFGCDNSVSEEAIGARRAAIFWLRPRNTGDFPFGFGAPKARKSASEARLRPCRKTRLLRMITTRARSCKRGMADYTVHTMMVSLNVEDARLGYNPPLVAESGGERGYNERETVQARQSQLHQFRAPMDAQLEWLGKDRRHAHRQGRPGRRRTGRA